MLRVTKEWAAEKWKSFRDNLFNQKTHPHDIAFAYALGIFIGVLPGVDLLLGFLVLLFFRINKVALIAGMATINPLTAPFIYALSFQLGKSLIGYTPLEEVGTFSTANIWNISKPLIVGNFLLALTFALTAYVVVYVIAYFFVYVKHKSADKKLEREFEEFEEKAEQKKITFKKERSADKKSADSKL